MSDAIRSYLEVHTPYRICGEADDGTAAIEKATESSCDLILLDASMLTSVETAAALRDILPRLKIVGFSTAGQEVQVRRLAAAGFDVVLSKQDGVAKLAETVRALLSAPN